MQSWLPVPGTTSGRLVEAALELFGAHGFAAIGVGAISERAGVTTGSLYHHFGSKEGLYRLVRTDVERRVLDRLEGAAAARPVRKLAELAPVLGIGFDYLIASGYARMLAEPSPEPSGASAGTDAVEELLSRWIPDGEALSPLVAAAWRAALWHASTDQRAVEAARTALIRLLTGDDLGR
jgi:AcrR family transcriptional regulator